LRTGTGRFALLDRLQFLVAHGFIHRPAHPQDDEGADAADQERQPPAPFADGIVRGSQQQRQEQRLREHMAAHQSHIMKRCQKAAMPGHGGFGQVGGRSAVFAAGGETLDQAAHDQDDGGKSADGKLRRGDRDGEGTYRHDRHRQGQRRAAAVAVGKAAEIPRADRAHEERQCEDGPDVDIGIRVFGAEEMMLERGCEHRIDVNVIPFDQSAGRSLDSIGNRPAQIGRHAPSVEGCAYG
jgi:hypothetical protein